MTTEAAHMKPAKLTLEYWKDGACYVGRIREVPSVRTQGRSLDELRQNIREAYRLWLDGSPRLDRPAKQTTIVLDLVG